MLSIKELQESQWNWQAGKSTGNHWDPIKITALEDKHTSTIITIEPCHSVDDQELIAKLVENAPLLLQALKVAYYDVMMLNEKDRSYLPRCHAYIQRLQQKNVLKSFT